MVRLQSEGWKKIFQVLIGPIPIAVPCVVAPLFPTWAQSAHEEAFVLVDPGGKVDSTNVLIDVAEGWGISLKGAGIYMCSS